MPYKPLITEYRGGIAECRFDGIAAICGKDGLLYSVGDASHKAWYRSASKPLQALPVLTLGIDKQYNLEEAEIAVMCSSHYGDEEHINAVASILKKASLSENDMCMSPSYPMRASRRSQIISEGLAPRKIYHVCSGKHAALMLSARHISGTVSDYWESNSKVQEYILNIMSDFTDVPTENILIGQDGCGVPVYAVSMAAMAKSFLRFACPELLANPELSDAAARTADAIHRFPDMISGKGLICSVLSADPELIVKSGAQGVMCIGIRAMQLGIAIKISCGNNDAAALSALHVLELLGYESKQTALAHELYPGIIINDRGAAVGQRKAEFTF